VNTACEVIALQLSGTRLPDGSTIARLFSNPGGTIRANIIRHQSHSIAARIAEGKQLAERSTNLMYQRAEGSVWDKRGWKGVTIEERVVPWMIGAAGAAAITYGASRRSWRGLAFALGGLTMWTCATMGLCNPRNATSRLDHLLRQRDRDHVTTQSMHSFPASDPPSFTRTAATVSRLKSARSPQPPRSVRSKDVQRRPRVEVSSVA